LITPIITFSEQCRSQNSLLRTSVRSTAPPTLLKKGRSVPLQAWTDPEGSRKLRFPDYVTHRMVVGCQPYAPAAFTPQEILPALISVRSSVDPRAIGRIL
jgi:hypothetical protein